MSHSDLKHISSYIYTILLKKTFNAFIQAHLHIADFDQNQNKTASSQLAVVAVRGNQRTETNNNNGDSATPVATTQLYTTIARPNESTDSGISVTGRFILCLYNHVHISPLQESTHAP